MAEYIVEAERLSDAVGEIVIVLKSGEELHGFTGGIHPDENDDGEFLGYRLLFSAKELDYPIFLRDKDINSVRES